MNKFFYKFYLLNSTDLPVMTQPTDSFEEIDSAVVRFAGDSGDGMQTVGERFTDSSAFAGNDIATLPDFPAEIRAPAGTLAGVSGFQLQFGNSKILTPGDAPDALVAMNPAALKANIAICPRVECWWLILIRLNQ